MQLLTKIQILNNCMFGKLKKHLSILSKRDAKLRKTGVAKYINSTSSREFEECLDKAG